MKTADFAAHLTEFLSHYLPELKNISTNTISSYCDAFRLFLGYCQDVEGMRIEKLSIDDLTPELVDHFLQWLRIERNKYCPPLSRRRKPSGFRVAAVSSEYWNMREEEVLRIINYCTETGLFNAGIWKQYGILTYNKIYPYHIQD